MLKVLIALLVLIVSSLLIQILSAQIDIRKSKKIVSACELALCATPFITVIALAYIAFA